MGTVSRSYGNAAELLISNGAHDMAGLVFDAGDASHVSGILRPASGPDDGKPLAYDANHWPRLPAVGQGIAAD